MHALSEFSDELLLQEYKRSIKRLESLSDDVPKWVRDIRLEYHDQIGLELVIRRLRALKIEREITRALAEVPPVPTDE